MPSFDANSFLSNQGLNPGGEIVLNSSGEIVSITSSNPVAVIENLATSFGIPSCLFELDIINAALIPSPVLVPMRFAMEEAERKTKDVINSIAKWIKVNLGISIFPDRNGRFGFFSGLNKLGIELGGQEFISAMGSMLAAFNAAANAATQVYQNYQNTVAQLRDIQACVGQLMAVFGSKGEGQRKQNLLNGGYQQAVAGQNAWAQAQLADAQETQSKARAVIEIIDTVLAERELNPDLEPKLIDVADATPVESVFRLQAGPPEAVNGQFVLSVDGLYYDSSNGLMPALMELASKKKSLDREKYWNLDFDPNLGGRGSQFSTKDLRYYFDSILDPKIIDNSAPLQKFYNQDRVLMSIVGQRDRKVYDVSSQLGQMRADGVASILIDNTNQSLISEVSYFNEKADKRKKQIELAVKVPVLYGKGPIYDPGEIPINDFSYMEGTNFLMEVTDQQKIIIGQDDVEGVVLPLEVKYTQKINSNDPVVVDHLLLAGIARAAIIDHDVPSSGAPILPVKEVIVESHLIALYNLLTVNATTPEGEDFGLFNSSEKGIDYNARIVGETSSLFNNGLGISYLEGVSSNSYIRLPAVSELQDLVYSKKGCTFETWIQASGLLENSAYNLSSDLGHASGLYRLILANENVGIASGVSPQDNREILTLDEGTSVVRGLIMGFTRDRRFVSGAPASNANEHNQAENAQFLIAPTQSYNSSSLGFINKEPCNANNTNWHGLTVPVSSSFTDLQNSFCHLAVTFDPIQDKVSVYLDSQLLAASGYYDTFGTGSYLSPKIPSLTLSSSFEYASSGPKLDKFFTPWIIGGGYTDGCPVGQDELGAGGFTGGTYGGFISGLQGKLGSLKFYSRPLTSSQIAQNYNANKNFFKFVKLS